MTDMSGKSIEIVTEQFQLCDVLDYVPMAKMVPDQFYHYSIYTQKAVFYQFRFIQYNSNSLQCYLVAN